MCVVNFLLVTLASHRTYLFLIKAKIPVKHWSLSLKKNFMQQLWVNDFPTPFFFFLVLTVSFGHSLYPLWYLICPHTSSCPIITCLCLVHYCIDFWCITALTFYRQVKQMHEKWLLNVKNGKAVKIKLRNVQFHAVEYRTVHDNCSNDRAQFKREEK